VNDTSLFLPELVYVAGRFVRDTAVVADATGVITYVGPAEEAPVGGAVAIERMPGCALVPGLVNGHSHAFQRMIRGWTQWKPERGAEADFWSWRDAMYRAVLQLTAQELYDVSRFCFIEMLLAGYTTVGEFHYVHRDEQGDGYADPNELAFAVVRAAEDAGIRIALLNVCYATGGVGEPLRELQRRFASGKLEDFLKNTDALRLRIAGIPLASVGLAPHSIRAVPREWLQPMAQHARKQSYPLHMHVSEQPAEVNASLVAYGQRPGFILADEGVLGTDFTAVHGTHLSAGEIAAFGAAGVTVCACPTTERDLGDGILAAPELQEAGARFCIGSDSQSVVDPFAEMRALEYHTRLRTLRRVVLAEETETNRWDVAPVLLTAGTLGGAHALAVNAGAIEPGKLADFIVIDLEHTALAGWTDKNLSALLTLSAPTNVVRDVWVGGHRVVEQREHPLLRNARARFDAACGRALA
jgi:formimidoylglutamate deiminase